MTTQIGIFSTWFKAFETEFTAKTSLRTFLTIYLALSQRLTQVGKDPYLLELLELHQIGAHALPSPRRATLLLASSRTDGPIDRKSREKVLSLSKTQNAQPLPFLVPATAHFVFKNGEDNTIHVFVLLSINFHLIPIMSLSLGFFTLGTI